MNILLAEDDSILLNGLTKALSRSGYQVTPVTTGEEAEFSLSNYTFDLIILDLGLPQIDGLQLLKNFRFRKKNSTPVMIMTARDSLEARVTGLDLGADDYLTKPFELPELEARVRALIRRSNFLAQTEIIYGDIHFDTVARRVKVGDQSLELSAREIKLLEFLLGNMGRVLSKEKIMESIYGWDDEIGSNAVEVTIHRLRKKLDPHGFKLQTIRGLGYLVDKP